MDPFDVQPGSEAVVILSGGLDSTTLLHWVRKVAKQEVHALTFRYGQRHAKEIACANIQATYARVKSHLFVPMDFMERVAQGASSLIGTQVAVPSIKEVMGDPQPTTYVPNRNMIFVAIAVARAEAVGAKHVYLGIQRHDIYGYHDATVEFAERLENVLRLNRKNEVHLMTPFADYSKADIVRIGQSLGVRYDKTWSCYNGREKACGVCGTCAERLAAFEENNLIDPLPYETR